LNLATFHIAELAAGANAGGDEALRFGKACFESADGFYDFVALLEPASADAEMQFFQGLGQTPALTAPHSPLFVPAWFAAGQQVIDVAALEQFDLDLEIVRQALPTRIGQLALKFLKGMAARGEQITAAFFAEESEGVLVDHAAIHDPDALAFAETGFDGGDDVANGLEIAGVAGEGLMGQRKAVTRDDQSDNDLLTIAAVIAGIAALGEIVVFGKTFKISAGEIVEQQFVVELEQSAELCFEIVLDGDLGSPQAVEGAIKSVLGDEGVGDAEQFLQGGGSIPMLGQGEFAARLAEAIDDLDGDDVGGTHVFLALGQVTIDDALQVEKMPQPAGEPDIAEAAAVRPADGINAHTDDVGIVGKSQLVIVGKKS
jgi:hypothetical protein